MASSVRLTTASIRTGPSWAKRCGNAVLDLGRIFDADAADSDRFSHRREVRIVEFRAKIQKAGGFLLELDEAKGAVVEYDDFHRQP